MPEQRDERAPGPVLVAAATVAVQALGLLVATVILLVKTVDGDPRSVPAALLGTALTLVAAVALGFGSRGLLHLSPAARTPVVVLELLALPISYDLAFQADRLGYGAPILVSALAVLYLLFTPTSRESLDRQRPF